MKVIVECDGGSRGNPGPAGFGCVVWSADHGTLLAEHKQAIGITTNNVAEYRALIAGLEEARRLGADEVAVAADSKLIIEQMSGRWKVKHPDMAELHQQARALASTFDAVTYEWIPRERNAHADRLANEAMDAAAGGGATIADPPPGAVAVPPATWTGNQGAPTRMLLLRHGQTGNILMTSRLQQVLLVPQKATFEVLDHRYVFLIDEEQKLHATRVHIGAELQHLFVVREGLEAKDRFLLEGLRRVKDGDEVDVEVLVPDSVVAHLELYSE